MLILRPHAELNARTLDGRPQKCSGSAAPAYTLPQDLRELADTRLCPSCKQWVLTEDPDERDVSMARDVATKR